MKWIWLLLFVLCSAPIYLFAQDPSPVDDPVGFLSGKWIQKTTSIDPAPENDSWKSQMVLNDFTPILRGQGLHRTVSLPDGRVVEGYFFHDSASGKFYGMSVDENGYVWQTESQVDADGNFSGNKGGPINDPSVRLSTELEFLSENEVGFTQIWTDKEGSTTIKGTLIRIPR